MLLVLLFTLGLGMASPPTPPTDQGPPTLIVQVVDPALIPLPESEVSVKPPKGKGSLKSTHADANGYAKFWVDTGVKYTIEAKADRFNKKVLKNVFVAQATPASPTTHIQMKLQPTPPSNY